MQDLARFRQCLKRAARRLIGSTRSLRGGSDISRAAALQAQPAYWRDWLVQNGASEAPRLRESPGLGVDPRVHIVGLTWQTCQAHQWLHRVPLPELAVRELDPARCRPHEIRLRPWAAAPAGGITRLALNLALPPLTSAVKVANGVDWAFEMMVLNSVMYASVPSCISITSVDDTSFVVVLLIDMKYLAAL